MISKGNYWASGGKTNFVRCPKCGMENYAMSVSMSVSSGVCAWCGFNANKPQEWIDARPNTQEE